MLLQFASDNDFGRKHGKEIHKSILNPPLNLEEDQSIWHLTTGCKTETWVWSIKSLILVSGKPQKTCDLDDWHLSHKKKSLWDGIRAELH